MSYLFDATSSQRIRKTSVIAWQSVSIWFYPTNSGLTCTLFSVHNALLTVYQKIVIQGATDDKVILGATGGGLTTLSSTGTVNYNAWNHVYVAIGVADPTKCYMSLNRESLVTGSFGGSGLATVTTLGGLGASEFYTGRIAQFAAWNMCLNDIDDRYKIPGLAFEPSLVPVDPNGTNGISALNLLSDTPLLGNLNDLVTGAAWLATNTPTVDEHCRVHRRIAA